MADYRPDRDRILVAQLTGTAGHHAKWRELTGDEEAAAVSELRQLADGRGDLLAEVAGILEGASEGDLSEPIARQSAWLCRQAGAARRPSRPGSKKAAAGKRTRAGRRSQTRTTGARVFRDRLGGAGSTRPPSRKAPAQAPCALGDNTSRSGDCIFRVAYSRRSRARYGRQGRCWAS
jgi:hypothetical protein